MKRFLWWAHPTDGLERAKRADAEATERLIEAKATARWAENALKTNGFADALMTIMRGEAT